MLDTPPELRLQLVTNGIDWVDAVLFTHDHADHTHGVDDIRAITVRRDAPLPMYGPPATLENLAKRFPYIFDENIRPAAGTSTSAVLVSLALADSLVPFGNVISCCMAPSLINLTV